LFRVNLRPKNGQTPFVRETDEKRPEKHKPTRGHESSRTRSVRNSYGWKISHHAHKRWRSRSGL